MHNQGLVKTRRFREPKYVGDVLNSIKIFNEKEVDELLLVDIDATVKLHPPKIDYLRKLATESRMPLCYGGGVNSCSQALQIITSGFEKVSISAGALIRSKLIREISEAIGRQSVVVTIDVMASKSRSGYSLYTHNGTRRYDNDLIEFCQEAESLGAGEIVVNSIDRDGEMGGYDLNLAQIVHSSITIPMTMLGGAGSIEHMRALVNSLGTVGAAAGSMFLFKGPYRAVLITYERP